MISMIAENNTSATQVRIETAKIEAELDTHLPRHVNSSDQNNMIKGMLARLTTAQPR